jgi:hypothetical protein
METDMDFDARLKIIQSSLDGTRTPNTHTIHIDDQHLECSCGAACRFGERMVHVDAR